MPPSRDARSTPRVHGCVSSALDKPQNDPAEEIRVIRDGLDKLEQKHDELQKKHDDLVEVKRVGVEVLALDFHLVLAVVALLLSEYCAPSTMRSLSLSLANPLTTSSRDLMQYTIWSTLDQIVATDPVWRFVQFATALRTIADILTIAWVRTIAWVWFMCFLFA